MKIEIKEIEKTFGLTTALQPVSLDIPSGALVALLGPSGSGKSTLLSIMGTLMRPSSGSYQMLGQELTSASDAALSEFRNRHIGFVFQFHHLLPDLNALENVVFPAALAYGRERRQDFDRGRDLLERVGLSHRLKFRPAALSGGQKQRVAIARALMMKPDLVLADEPTGNLDRESALQVMELIAQMNREEETSFLISTHDEEIARACRDRIYIREGLAFAGGEKPR